MGEMNTLLKLMIGGCVVLSYLIMCTSYEKPEKHYFTAYAGSLGLLHWLMHRTDIVQVVLSYGYELLRGAMGFDEQEAGYLDRLMGPGSADAMAMFALAFAVVMFLWFVWSAEYRFLALLELPLQFGLHAVLIMALADRLRGRLLWLATLPFVLLALEKIWLFYCHITDRGAEDDEDGEVPEEEPHRYADFYIRYRDIGEDRYELLRIEEDHAMLKGPEDTVVTVYPSYGDIVKDDAGQLYEPIA